MPRAVVDTSVWISSVLNRSGAPRQLRSACEEGRFELITSEPMLEEAARVLAKPRLARAGITREDAAELLAFLRDSAEIVTITGVARLCRDPNDDMVIETALRGNAEVLVSRDADLTRAPDLIAALEESGLRVLTVRQFLEELAESSTPADET